MPQDKTSRCGEPYTESELLRAISLKENGLSWDVIASRLGRGRSSLKSQVTRYRRGRIHFRKLRYNEIYDRIIEEVIRGVPHGECAKRYGLHKTAVYDGLKRRGWDLEMIELERQERLSA